MGMEEGVRKGEMEGERDAHGSEAHGKMGEMGRGGWLQVVSP